MKAAPFFLCLIVAAQVSFAGDKFKDLSVLGFSIGKSTLNEVKHKFKSKTFYHESAVGTSLDVLCYRTPSGSTIAFESGPMGGASRLLTSVAINGPKEKYRLDHICEKTSLIKSKLSIDGISLGMSPELVKRLKGAPSRQAGNTYYYRYEDKDMVTSFDLVFKDDMITHMRASQIESL